MAGLAAAKITTKKTKLPARKRKLLVDEFQSEEQEISANVLDIFWKGIHFEEYKNRESFRNYFQLESNSKPILECICTMQQVYKKLLAKFTVGKKFLQLQQSWYLHLSFYFEGAKAVDVDGLQMDDKEKCRFVWNKVTTCADDANLSLTLGDKRIILSSLAYAVFDVMMNEFKEKKKEQLIGCSHDHFQMYSREDTVTLYRYGGAALHSMIEKLKKKSKHHPHLPLLLTMSSDIDNTGLNQGGMTSMSSMLLPFLDALFIEVNKSISHEQLKKHGKNMIKVALQEILENLNLEIAFRSCVKQSDTVSEESYEEIRIEFTKKVFHSRVNEFFEAQKELDLEKTGKVTDAQQSLRDELKTYSNSKIRKTK